MVQPGGQRTQRLRAEVVVAQAEVREAGVEAKRLC